MIALDGADGERVGPVWAFQIDATCNDPVSGAPTVTSATSQSDAAGTTSGSYRLTSVSVPHQLAGTYHDIF